MRAKLLSLFMFFTSLAATSQDVPSQFFDKNGTVAVETKELDAKADTIAVIQHRRDDVVWSKVVYRIIDLRDMQNRPLLNPLMPTDENKNLLRILLESVASGKLKGYEVPEKSFLPNFSKPLDKRILLGKFKYYSVYNNAIVDTSYVFDSSSKKDSVGIGYEEYAKRQYKFLIKEIVFFNKHYSKMYTKVIGLAPMYNFSYGNLMLYHLPKSKSDWYYFTQSIPCWFLYDEFRPFLAQNYIKDSNKTVRMTFDDFFQMKLYSSYILGDDNTTDKMLLQLYQDETRIKYEQDRIEREILNVEQDVWEY